MKKNAREKKNTVNTSPSSDACLTPRVRAFQDSAPFFLSN
jgi:hypothetical protein